MSWETELAHPDFEELKKALLPPGSLVRRYFAIEELDLGEAEVGSFMERGKQMRRYLKGDRVLTPPVSLSVPLAQIVAAFEGIDGDQVLEVKPAAWPTVTRLHKADELTYVGDREFIEFDGSVYHVGTGAKVADSEFFSAALAEFLNWHCFEMPRQTEAERDAGGL